MNKIYKHKIDVLYIHGYNGSGSGSTANTIRELLPVGRYNFISLQLSNTFADVGKNIKEINYLISRHKPKIVIGNSLGGFEVMAANYSVYKILINPVYNPIADSKKPEIFDESFHAKDSKKMIEDILDRLDMENQDRSVVYGFFGAKDDVVNCKPQFSKLFGADKMKTLPNAGHQLNRDELSVVVDLIEDIYETESTSFDKNGYVKQR